MKVSSVTVGAKLSRGKRIVNIQAYLYSWDVQAIWEIGTRIMNMYRLR